MSRERDYSKMKYIGKERVAAINWADDASFKKLTQSLPPQKHENKKAAASARKRDNKCYSLIYLGSNKKLNAELVKKGIQGTWRPASGNYGAMECMGTIMYWHCEGERMYLSGQRGTDVYRALVQLCLPEFSNVDPSDLDCLIDKVIDYVIDFYSEQK